MAVRSASRRGTAAVRLGVGIVVSLVLAACGSDGDPAESSTDDPSVTGQTTQSAATAGPDAPSADTFEEPGVDDTDEDAARTTSAPDDDPAITTTSAPDDDPAIAPTPSANTGANDQPAATPDDEVVPASVPGPTVLAQLEEDADFGTGVIASVVEVEAVEVVGRLPGEHTGPGVLVTIEVRNGSNERISVDFVTVDLIRADGSSAIPVELPGQSFFSGDLEAGATTIAKYQFFLPVEQRASATITVSYASGVPTALFSGDLPDV